MAQTAFSVSVIVPVYNEIELTDSSVRAIHEFLTRGGRDFEIILVESGSSDGTADVCDVLASSMPGIRVIHEATRNGMGAALRLGHHAATKNYVCLAPVDLPFPLTALDEAMPLLREYECVLSYRPEDGRGFLRRIQSVVYAGLIRGALGLPMRSVNSAFKLLPRAFVTSVPLRSKGWLLDAEILYWIKRKGCRYAEIPVPLIERTAGASSVTAMDWIKVCGELLAFKRSVARNNVGR